MPAAPLPSQGQIVHVRSRQHLVEQVVPRRGEATLVRLSCLADDSLGEQTQVLWEREVDARVLGGSAWNSIAARGFDDPRLFSAYLHTLRWSCVTATDPDLFQAPYRAGIRVKSYQLEPLRRALLMPRVSLFIADDVGLGKTIEAGLIVRELLHRQKIRRIVVACPPSVVRQWQMELETRFGLPFLIYDRDFVAARRRERGFGINPFTTHTRFILSHALLRDEDYAAPLRAWLGDFMPGSLLILDEAHNAAPASGARYAVDSQLTKTVRNLAPRFEHKLFLSATPHNGHSNSFSALLEMLDPQRFCRGVPVDPGERDKVMVRRLKSDLKGLVTDQEFADRHVVPLIIDDLPEDAPELRLSALLAQYRTRREARLAPLPKGQATAAKLVTTSLQKRLLSSIRAFALTLHAHQRALNERRAKEERAAKAAQAAAPLAPPPAEELLLRLPLLEEAPGADDERATLPEAEIAAEEAAEVARVEAALPAPAADTATEADLLAEMTRLAAAARDKPDRRVQYLVRWIKEHLCPDLGRPGATWLPRRVLLFTEYADTKSYLLDQLQTAIAGSDRAEARIATFTGELHKEEEREDIQNAFNAPPTEHPLRILIATDAAREGLNLHNHCKDLFHFDIPWNPSRMEQRNGRIDRVGQKGTVTCRYFLFDQRVEDQVLRTLVEKTSKIRAQLGSLSPVLSTDMVRILENGISHDEAAALKAKLEGLGGPRPAEGAADAAAGPLEPGEATVAAELEPTRAPKMALEMQLRHLDQLLERARTRIGFDEAHFRNALSAALSLQGVPGLAPVSAAAAAEDASQAAWTLPTGTEGLGADPSWAVTLDALRRPRTRDEKPWDWRKEAPVRPVVFTDPGNLDGKVVHLHLEHRVVQRLLARFLAQGFVRDELSRACVVRTEHNLRYALALGRLSLYGDQAARLHEEVLAVAMRFTAIDRGVGRPEWALEPLSEHETSTVLQALETALLVPRLRAVTPEVQAQFQGRAAQDVPVLRAALEAEAKRREETARGRLRERGTKEARDMRTILTTQRKKIQELLDRPQARQQVMDFDEKETAQREAERRYWPTRLKALEGELETEPDRIRKAYEVRATRVEPVGLVYLVPLSA